MTLRDAAADDRHSTLRRGALLFAVLLFLLSAAPVRGDQIQSSFGTGAAPAGAEGGTPASGTEPQTWPAEITPQTSPAPQPEGTEAAPPSPPPAKPAPAVPAAPSLPEAYAAPLPGTAISAFDSEFAADETRSITVQRSGGLAPLLFDNKAGNWISGGLTLEQSYDNNVYLRQVKREDFITRVSPNLAFRFQNQLLEWSLGSSLDYRYYARNSRTGDLSLGLTTNGRITLYRDYAYIIVSDSYNQTSRSNAVDYSALSSSTDVTDLNTLRINPRLELPVTSRIRFNPQYTYTNYWYPTQSQQNRQSHAIAADFSYELSPRLMPALGYTFIRMDGNYRYDQHYPYFQITFKDYRLTFNGKVGYSTMNHDNEGSSNDLVWSVSASYDLASIRFTLSTASDVDQSVYLGSSQNTRKTPQLATTYAAGMTKDFQGTRVAINLYYQENNDVQSSILMSRRIGTSCSLIHELSPRLSGSVSSRVERSDQRTVAGIPLQDLGGYNTLLYQFWFTLSYRIGSDWNVAANYSYTDSASERTTPYTDNKVSLSVSKSF